MSCVFSHSTWPVSISDILQAQNTCPFKPLRYRSLFNFLLFIRLAVFRLAAVSHRPGKAMPKKQEAGA